MPDEEDARWIKKVDPPYYVKKLPSTAGAIGKPEDSIEVKAALISQNLLAPNSDGKVSLFLINIVEELLQVQIALHHFNDQSRIRLFAITPSELARVNLFGQLKNTPENCDIPCAWMKSRHHDLLLTPEQRKQLAGLIAQEWRGPGYPVRKNNLAYYTNEARKLGCFSVVEDSVECRACSPVSHVASSPG
jgi:hypothetical protein